MIWIGRIILVILYMFFLDFMYGLIGLLIYRYKTLHRIGIFFMALSPLFCKLIPSRCRMNCKSDKCINWTCPNYCSNK